MQITIRHASPEDASSLTTLTFASKRHWNYPEAWLEVWKGELTITTDYITSNIVRLAESDGAILGYYSIVENPHDRMVGKVFVRQGFWLEHLFIHPAQLRQGIGTMLLNHALKTCREHKVTRLFIFADPNAKGFYEKVGENFLGYSLSSIEGRLTPVFELLV